MGTQRYVVIPTAGNESSGLDYVAFRLGEDREEEYKIGDKIEDLVGSGDRIFAGISIDSGDYYSIAVVDGIIVAVNQIAEEFYREISEDYK